MASTAHIPGEPPPVRDEAADTPLWVPALGLALLLLAAIGLVWQTATDEEASAADETAEVEGDAPEGDDAAEEAPAEPTAEAAPE